MPVPVTAPSPGVKTNVRWNMFLLLLLLVTISYVDRAALSVAMPLISKEFNLTPALQGLLLEWLLLDLPADADSGWLAV